MVHDCRFSADQMPSGRNYANRKNYREHIDAKKPKNVLFPSKISNSNNTILWQY